MASKNHRRYKKRKQNIHTPKPITIYNDDTIECTCWDDLRNIESKTHVFVVKPCGGDLDIKNPKNDDEWWENHVYLSSHTFYSTRNAKQAERHLRDAGFNVKLTPYEDIFGKGRTCLSD